MTDQPYDFIDTNNPEKKQAEKKMEEAAEKGKLFGPDGTERTFDPNEEVNPEDWPETSNRVFHHEEDQKEKVGPIGKVVNILKSIFR